MKVRPATVDDIEAILELQEILFPGDPNSLDSADMERHISRWPSYLQVADMKGEINGFIVLKDRPTRPWTSCDFVGVSSRAQGAGAGSALVKAGLAAARRPFLRLFVRPSNTAARALYKRLDFFHISTRKGNYEDGEDAMVLMKWAGLGPGKSSRTRQRGTKR